MRNRSMCCGFDGCPSGLLIRTSTFHGFLCKGHITQSMLFPLISRTTCNRNSQKRYKTSGSSTAGCSARILIKLYENEHFRWFVSQDSGPSPDCPRSRCARHRAPRATRKGNTHFHGNALVAPSARLRTLTGATRINSTENQQKEHALGDIYADCNRQAPDHKIELHLVIETGSPWNFMPGPESYTL